MKGKLKALLDGHCDVDKARRRLTFDMRASWTGACAEVEATRPDQRPETRSEKERQKEKTFEDRGAEENGESRRLGGEGERQFLTAGRCVRAGAGRPRRVCAGMGGKAWAGKAPG